MPAAQAASIADSPRTPRACSSTTPMVVPFCIRPIVDMANYSGHYNAIVV
jgi:hypothetical protein